MTNCTETHWTRILSYDLFTGEDTESSGHSIEWDESNGSPKPVVRPTGHPYSSTQPET